MIYHKGGKMAKIIKRSLGLLGIITIISALLTAMVFAVFWVCAIPVELNYVPPVFALMFGFTWLTLGCSFVAD